jgi:putative ABC transport system permease protein
MCSIGIELTLPSQPTTRASSYSIDRVLSPAALLLQALRSLGRHKARAALNALGIAVGVASVVWVIAIGEAGGARATEQLHALGDNLVWVEAGSRSTSGVRTGTFGMRNLMLEDGQAIGREVPEIRSMSPNIDGTLLAVSETHNWTTHWRGVSPEYFDIKRWSFVSGGPFDADDVDRAVNVCVIGETVNRQLFGDRDPVGEIVRIGAQPFRVVGLLAPKGQSATGSDQDDTLVVPYTTGIKKIRGDGQTWLDDVLCSTRRPEDIAPAADAIRSLLRERHHLAPEQDDDFNIRHPEDLIKAGIDASNTLEALLVSLASVSLLVGGIGVMNVMLASVVERTREIGVRLAVGAPDWAVQAQFLVEAVLLTSMGGAAGVLVSVGGAAVIARTLGWPVPIPPQAVGVALTFSVATGLVFGFFPARRAARLEPIEALRSE